LEAVTLSSIAAMIGGEGEVITFRRLEGVFYWFEVGTMMVDDGGGFLDSLGLRLRFGGSRADELVGFYWSATRRSVLIHLDGTVAE
jgi:hypothetical protein